jgi:tripartite-type tricarboxylate transporter receptor subunit TctC
VPGRAPDRARRALSRALAAAPLGAALAAVASRAGAQGASPAFPARTITLIGPFSAGASTDVISRLYATRLSTILGVPVVVENKPGAGGMLSVGTVARAQPDGYTLLVVSNTFLIAPHVYRNASYDPHAGFLPVAGLFTTPIALVAKPDFPAKDLAEFVALARRAPGKYTYSTWGIGTSAHLQMELVRLRTGIELVHTPYKSGPEASQAVMGGFADVGFDTVFSIAPKVRDGRVKALAVFAPARAAVLPDAPTNVEAGFPGIEQVGFCGVLAPAGTPRDVIARLAQASRQVLADPDYAARLSGFGADPLPMTPEQLDRFLREETAKIREVTTASRISAD